MSHPVLVIFSKKIVSNALIKMSLWFHTLAEPTKEMNIINLRDPLSRALEWKNRKMFKLAEYY